MKGKIVVDKGKNFLDKLVLREVVTDEKQGVHLLDNCVACIACHSAPCNTPCMCNMYRPVEKQKKYA